MEIDDLMKQASKSQAKQFEAMEKIAEIKITMAEKISKKLENIEELTIEEIKFLTNLLREINNLK